jgi:APA family basic amino acid/polyamine antiporter
VYILVGVVAVGLVGASSLAASYSPLVFAIGATGSTAAVRIVSIGGMVATASVLLTSILGVSRMIFSMARGGDMPRALSKVNNRFGTPHLSILAIGGVMTLLVLFFDLTGIIVVSTFALLFWYILVNAAAFKLEKKNGERRRFLPILGVATCLSLLVAVIFIEPVAWTAGVTCLLVGTIVYVLKMISGTRHK